MSIPTTPRKLSHDTFDAYVGLLPLQGAATSALALVKVTFTFSGSGVVAPAPPEPLNLSPLGVTGPCPIPHDTDFWPEKAATDVVVLGNAQPYSNTPVERMTVRIAVGAAEKRIAVSGRRTLVRAGAGVRIGPPRPFTQIGLGPENAYGGMGLRTSVGEAAADLPGDLLFGLEAPGRYPRNPAGKGYVVGEAPSGEIELPNLEDPTDLLTEDRVIVPEPALWYRQPLPWHTGWTSPGAFPRCVHLFRGDTRYPGPEDERMPEVQRGYLRSGYRTGRTAAMDPAFCQQASLGLVIPRASGGEPVALEGCSPHAPEIRFALPAPPRIRLACETACFNGPGHVHTVILRPDEGICVMVSAARLELPRTFVPGIHKRIPVTLTVDGGAPIAFEAPPTWKELRGRGSAR